MKTVLVALAIAGAQTASFAADRFAGPNAAEYRLNLETPAAFRLSAKERDVSLPAPRGNPAVSARLADKPYAKLIEEAARKAALDPALVHAIVSVESGYNPAAHSPKGAIGLMQVLPQTAARYGVSNAARSPAANLRVGTRYLSDLMELFGNHIELVLAAYNAGENAVLRHGRRIPPYRETQRYVPAVLAIYGEWRAPSSATGPDTIALPSPARIQYIPGTDLNPDALRRPPLKIPGV